TAQDLLFTPVSELRRQIGAKVISPVELVEASLARIEELNPTINAFVYVAPDEARAAARESEERVRRGEARPLEGIPIPIQQRSCCRACVGHGTGRSWGRRRWQPTDSRGVLRPLHDEAKPWPYIRCPDFRRVRLKRLRVSDAHGG